MIVEASTSLDNQGWSRTVRYKDTQDAKQTIEGSTNPMGAKDLLFCWEREDNKSLKSRHQLRHTYTCPRVAPSTKPIDPAIRRRL